jgi:hypothetical protein
MLPGYDVLVNLGAALMEKGEPLNAVGRGASIQPRSLRHRSDVQHRLASFVRGDMDGAVKGLDRRCDYRAA